MADLTYLHDVEPARPFINGKPFSELWGVTGEIRQLLIDRGLVWITEFERNGAVYSPAIIAASKEAAEAIAAERKLGEVVVGQLVEEGVL